MAPPIRVRRSATFSAPRSSSAPTNKPFGFLAAVKWAPVSTGAFFVTRDRRPGERRDPYAAAYPFWRGGRLHSSTIKFGGYGSPRARGRQAGLVFFILHRN